MSDNKLWAGMGAMPWLDDLNKLANKLQLPGVDAAALADWQRKDVETLVEANRQAHEGIKALIEKRNQILEEALGQWRAAVEDVTSAEATSKQAEAAKQRVDKAMANFRELTQIEAQARNNAWKVMQDRMQENLGNLQKLLQPK